MAAERNIGKRGTLVLLLCWAVFLLGLAAATGWLLTRPLVPVSYTVDRQAYEIVLPEESQPETPDEAASQDVVVPEATADPDAAGEAEPGEETELTRPPELREEEPFDGPRVEDAPLIARPAPGGDAQSASPPGETAASEPSMPEPGNGEETTAPAIPEEGVTAEDTLQAEDAADESDETEEADTRDEGDGQQPAFAPPQSSPGLPPPPIPGRATAQEEDDTEATQPPAEEENDPTGKETEDDRATSETPEETVQQAALPDPGELPDEEEIESTADSAQSAWQRYAQPFTAQEDRSLVAVVVSGLGLSDGATDAAIRQLPAEVTLSFSPYARRLDEWIALARSQGHEVLLDLPMEPENYPADDPGPQAILTELGPQENDARLQWVLGRGSAYVGVAATEGGGFTASRGALEPIFEQLAEKGLIFLGNPAEGATEMRQAADLAGTPFVLSDRVLDRQAASRSVIDSGLSAVERTALAEGEAIAVARPYPVSLERLQAWSEHLQERGLQLAPLSALLRQ